jgi:hypothetical protein
MSARAKLILIASAVAVMIFVGCKLGAAVDNLGNEIVASRTAVMGR